MFGITTGRTREKIIAVADIGSGSAAVAILALHPDKPAAVLAASRSVLPIEERTQEATIAGIGAHLAKSGEDAQKAYAARAGKGMKSVGSLLCVMRAPWSRSRVVQASSVFEHETLVTGELIAGLAQQALAGERELDRGNFLEASVVRVELNGYPTGEPEGKYAREAEVFALASDCDPRIRAEVEASLQVVFPHLSPLFRSGTRALVSVVRERDDRDNSSFIVDMASEATTLTVIRDGVMQDHRTIPEGVRTILKRVSASGMPEETLSLMRMLARDQCSQPACDDLRASLARVEPEFVRVFGEAMGKSASGRRLPDALLLIVNPDMAPWLSKFFSRIDFTQFTLTAQPFAVEALAPADFARWVLPESGVTLDSGIALSCALSAIDAQRS
jgi:hypothetical protein